MNTRGNEEGFCAYQKESRHLRFVCRSVLFFFPPTVTYRGRNDADYTVILEKQEWGGRLRHNLERTICSLKNHEDITLVSTVYLILKKKKNKDGVEGGE